MWKLMSCWIFAIAFIRPAGASSSSAELDVFSHNIESRERGYTIQSISESSIRTGSLNYYQSRIADVETILTHTRENLKKINVFNTLLSLSQAVQFLIYDAQPSWDHPWNPFKPTGWINFSLESLDKISSFMIDALTELHTIEDSSEVLTIQNSIFDMLLNPFSKNTVYYSRNIYINERIKRVVYSVKVDTTIYDNIWLSDTNNSRELRSWLSKLGTNFDRIAQIIPENVSARNILQIINNVFESYEYHQTGELDSIPVLI